MNRNNDDNDKDGDNDSSDSDDNDMISQPGADTVPFSIYTRMLECC